MILGTASTLTPVDYRLPSKQWRAAFRWDWNEKWEQNMHRDYAKKFGYKGGLVEGDVVFEHIIDILIQFFGEPWYGEGEIFVKVLPIYEGELLTTGAVVKERKEEERGVRLSLEVWMSKEDGKPGVIGNASCLVPWPSASPQKVKPVKLSHEGIWTRKEPRFGPGPLPEEYTPITYDAAVVGEIMGPIEFTISEASHKKHTAFQQIYHRWFTEESPWGGPILYPFETWCQARVHSRWKYGRINEALYASARWKFYKPAPVGEPLFGWMHVADKYMKRGKPYILTDSWTEDAKGHVIMHAREELVLMHEIKGMKIR